jgi:hypothetical protein
MRIGSSLLAVVYIVVGVIVAASHHYFAHLGTVRGLVSAVLAILLWPLVLLGINLHIKR